MTVTVTYLVHHPWNRPSPGAPASNRPYAEVRIHGPKASPRIWCLVDSGADHLQLSRAFAATAGIGFTGSRTVSTAGGKVTLDETNPTSLEVEGYSSSELCLFGSSSVQILGRVTFLNVFDAVGLDAKGWMFKV